jgi:hypothetical protein
VQEEATLDALAGVVVTDWRVLVTERDKPRHRWDWELQERVTKRKFPRRKESYWSYRGTGSKDTEEAAQAEAIDRRDYILAERGEGINQNEVYI